jgi:hypothetical protein
MKSALQTNPILVDTTAYFWIALAFAILISVIETPLLILNFAPAIVVFAAGWVIICGYTFYRVWWLHTHTLITTNCGFAQLLAGMFILSASAVLLYLAVQTSNDPEYSGNFVWRIKGAFAGNGLVAIDAATLAIFATVVAAHVGRIFDWFRR